MSVVFQVVKFAPNSPERLEYTAEQSQEATDGREVEDTSEKGLYTFHRKCSLATFSMYVSS